MVVTFISILVNVNGISSIIFMSLAENELGDTDFIITPEFRSLNFQMNVNEINPDVLMRSLNLMNTSQYNDNFENVSGVLGASPRILFPGVLIHPNDTNKTTQVLTLMGNSSKEISLGIGRALDIEPLKSNECYLTTQTAFGIELEEDNNEVLLNINIIRFLLKNELLNYDPDTPEETVARDIVDNFLPDSIELDINSLTESLNLGENPSGNEVVDQTLKDINASITENFGDIQFLNINITQYKDLIIKTIVDLVDINFPLKIKNKLEGPKGKWPENIGSVVYIEQSFFFERLRNETIDALNATAEEILKETIGDFGENEALNNILRSAQDSLVRPIIESYDAWGMNQTTMSMNAVVENKDEVYSSFQTYEKNLIKISNQIMDELGDPSKFSVVAPMFEGFSFLGFISNFVINIMYAILIVLIIIAIILITSLMVFNVDKRNYEFGMLRALGIKRKNLVAGVMIEGLVFAIAGWFLGLVTSFIGSSIITFIYFYRTKVKVYGVMDLLSWVISILIIVLATISNENSIKKSLSNNLVDSLNLYRRTSLGTKIVILRLKKLGISTVWLILGLELSIFGFMFYYLAPLTFFYDRIDLFLLLLNLIFLAMMIGLIVISNLFQSYIEVIVVWAVSYIVSLFEKKGFGLRTVILKNMKTHFVSNNKTALMITMSVAFIVFSGSGITTQAKGILNQIRAFQGSDVVVTNFEWGNASLNYLEITEYLNNYKNRFPDQIVNFTFSAKHIDSLENITSPKISPLSLYPEKEVTITAVEPNLMQSISTNLYVPDEYADDVDFTVLPNGVKDGVSPIFDDDYEETFISQDPAKILSIPEITTEMPIFREIKVVMPTGLKEFTSLETGMSAILEIKQQKPDAPPLIVQLKIIHTADKLPGFSFSSYSSVASENHDILMSFDVFRKIKEWANTPFTPNQEFEFEKNETKQKIGIPYDKLLIKLEDGVTSKQRSVLKNGLRNFLKDTDFLVDVIEFTNTTEEALEYVYLLNIIIATITSTLAFFMVLISLSKNIKDNIWELGILRSIGLNQSDIYIVYFIEVFTVVIIGLILGAFTGIFTSIALGVNYVIFFDLPFMLFFPYYEFFTLLAFLMLTSVLTTYIGLKRLKKVPITKLVKGLDE